MNAGLSAIVWTQLSGEGHGLPERRAAQRADADSFDPQSLRSYAGQRDRVEAEDAALDESLFDLDRQLPGTRFRMVDEEDRMRLHIVFFVRGAKTWDLNEPLAGSGEVVILRALSGG